MLWISYFRWAYAMTAESSDGTVRPFRHPYVMSWFIFFGELLSLPVYYIIKCFKQNSPENQELLENGKSKDCSPWRFLLPALLDAINDCLCHLGLIFTYVTSYDMLRGANIIFASLLSILFLRKKYGLLSWIGIILVVGGLAIVGYCDMIYPESHVNHTTQFSSHDQIIGNLLIVIGHAFRAVQIGKDT